MEMRERIQNFRQQHLHKYMVTIIIIFITTYLQLFLWPMIEPLSFLLFFPAIMLACYFGDGVLAIILSVIVSQYFFITPYKSFTLTWPKDYIRILLFIMAATFIRTVVRKQQKSKEESDKNLNSLLEEKAARENFVSSLTHDLQTPLTALRLSTQIILKRPDDKKIVINSGERIMKNLNRVEQMVQDILDANKIRAGVPLPLEVTEIDIVDIVKVIIAELNLIYHQRITLEYEQQIKGFWSADAIRRIVENLCSNAIKYGEEKGPINIRVSKLSSSVQIEVHNKGPCIPAYEQANLFDLYKRSLSAKRGGKKGWGLGLTLVKGLTRSMGGEVRVRSEEGFGTSFFVVLPLDVRSFVAQID